MRSIIAAVKDTKKKVNQDHCTVIEDQVKAVIVADGIGSQEYAEEGSKEVVKIAEKLLRQSLSDNIDMSKLFSKIQEELNLYVSNNDIPAKQQTFGTTCIIAIELPDKFIVGYLGNGAIFHIRGNVTSFNKNRYYLPWVCLNYLNPHTEPLQGEEALYKYFGFNNTKQQITPSIIEIKKDNETYGDILIICTDGVYSYDNIEVTKDGDQSIWIEGTQSLELLINEVKTFLTTGDLHNEGAQKTLKKYLIKLRELNLMSDDCSLGIICTEKALEYQNGLKDGNN